MGTEQMMAAIRKDEKLSVGGQCELLEINRSTVYYQPKGESEENLYIMRKLDERHLDLPTHGVIQMPGFSLRDRACRECQTDTQLQRLMGIMAHYPKRNMGKLGQARYMRPYLLRGLDLIWIRRAGKV